MSDYLKQKAPQRYKAEEYLEKDRKYSKDLMDLKSSPVEMVDDFQRTVVKDLPVDKIDRRGEIIPLKSGAEFQADNVIRDARRAAVEQASDTLNYKDLKKQFAEKARMAARSPVGKRMVAAVPFLGAGMAALSGEPAMAAEELAEDLTGPAGMVYGAAKPASTGPMAGSLDDRIAKGQLTEEDKQMLMQEQARIKALQSIK